MLLPYYSYRDFNDQWNHVGGAENEPAHPNLGMRLYSLTASKMATNLQGELWNIIPYSTPFPANSRNVVTYNLFSQQCVCVALGGFRGHVRYVIGQNWTWEYVHPNDCHHHFPMQFGHAYILIVKDEVTPIINFQWATRRDSPWAIMPQIGYHFTFESNNEIGEAINIEGILGDNNISEIGAFIGEVCIGSVLVDKFPVHIMIYPKKDQIDKPITFKYLCSDGKVVGKFNQLVDILCQKTGKSSKGEIKATGEIGSISIILDNSGSNQNGQSTGLRRFFRFRIRR